MALISENFRNTFGEIRLEVIFQDTATRVSCIHRVSDDEVLSFHIVLFQEEGITAIGAVHEKIVAGDMLGEVIQASAVPHTRTMSGKSSVEIDAKLAELFKTDERRCTTERIEYSVREIPYATIYEFYNPEYTPVAQLLGTLDAKVGTLMQKYLVGGIFHRNQKTQH